MDPEGLQGGSKDSVSTGAVAAGVGGGWWATSGLQYCLSETLAGGGVGGVTVLSASCGPASAPVGGDEGGDAVVAGDSACVSPGGTFAAIDLALAPAVLRVWVTLGWGGV